MKKKPAAPKKEFRLSDLKRAMEVFNALGVAVKISIVPIEKPPQQAGFIKQEKS